MRMSRLIAARPPDGWQADRYALAIGTIGYEARARHAFETQAIDVETRVALGFRDQQAHEYSHNRKWFERNKFSVQEPREEEYREIIEGLLKECALDSSGPLRILVDITSATRVRTAHVVAALMHEQRDIDATFVYSPALFTPPHKEAPPNSYVGPVLPEFAGWWPDPSYSTAAIVGLGYEEDKALGATEYLQASEVWTFSPISAVPAFFDAVVRANDTLLANVPEEQQSSYQLSDPVALTATIESLATGVCLRANPVILPFGPKLFALCALIVAARHRDVSVWRVSAGRAEPPVDRKPHGPIYAMTVQFRTVAIDEGRGLEDEAPE